MDKTVSVHFGPQESLVIIHGQTVLEDASFILKVWAGHARHEARLELARRGYVMADREWTSDAWGYVTARFRQDTPEECTSAIAALHADMAARTIVGIPAE